MALGGATKKLQKVANMGDELYSRINELRDQIVEMRETVRETNTRVGALEDQVDRQTALLEALAEHQDVDVDEVLADVAIDEAESDDDGIDAAETNDAEAEATEPDATDGDESATDTETAEE